MGQSFNRSFPCCQLFSLATVGVRKCFDWPFFFGGDEFIHRECDQIVAKAILVKVNISHSVYFVGYLVISDYVRLLLRQATRTTVDVRPPETFKYNNIVY